MIAQAAGDVGYMMSPEVAYAAVIGVFAAVMGAAAWITRHARRDDRGRD